MNSLFCMRTVAADSAADAALGNIRKQKELKLTIKEIDKQLSFVLKRIVNDRLDAIKEYNKMAIVKVHLDYFKDDIRRTRLHNYTDNARSKMRQQKYIKSHDNFNFTVDPLSKQAVPEPMIMEGDEKEGREAITSISLDKKRAKHIRGLSELKVKVRRFRIPKVKKKKKDEKNSVTLPPLPDRIKRLKRIAKQREKLAEIEELDEQTDSEDEETEERSHQATSISITHHHHETEQEAFERTSVFTIAGDSVPFARAYIPLPILPLTPEPSFTEEGDQNTLQPPHSPSQINTQLLSPDQNQLKRSRATSPTSPRSPRSLSPKPPRSPLPPIKQPSFPLEKQKRLLLDNNPNIEASASRPRASDNEQISLPNITTDHVQDGNYRYNKNKIRKGSKKSKHTLPKLNIQTTIENNNVTPRENIVVEVIACNTQDLDSDIDAAKFLPPIANTSTSLDQPTAQDSQPSLSKKQRGLLNLSRALNKTKRNTQKLSVVLE